MQLIMLFYKSDGCTYESEVILPIEYDSEEQLLYDFEIALKQAMEFPRSYVFNFIKYDFNLHDFCEGDYSDTQKSNLRYCLPEVFTLSKWFELNKRTNY